MPLGLLAIAGRVALVYALMLVMIRLLGKRTIGNLTAFDMLIALVMGDLAGNAIYGQVPLTHAITAVVALSALHYANSWLVVGNPRLARLLEGRSTVIVEHGRIVGEGLKRERMSEEEAVAELRLDGIEDLADVKVARVERDGRISVVREDWAEPARRGDLGGQAG
jgi:uncharacterized membrane protein YcaP (DUF421 family)